MFIQHLQDRIASSPVETCLFALMADLKDLIAQMMGTAHKGPSMPSTLSPPPAHGPRDCCLVLDASPSMAEKDWKPSRLAGAQEAAREFVRRLAAEEPDARVAVIFYSAMAKVHCALTPATQIDKLRSAIDCVRTRAAGTSISAGLRAAAGQLSDLTRPWQIVLLTDGHHNWGRSPMGVVQGLRSRAIIECVGIGGSATDVDEDLLRSLATSYPDGRKRYRWIGEPAELRKHFHELAGRITRQ